MEIGASRFSTKRARMFCTWRKPQTTEERALDIKRNYYTQNFPMSGTFITLRLE